MTQPPERSTAGPFCIAQHENVKTPPAPNPAVVLPRGRLAQLVCKIAALYRKAHLTAEEARYVHRRARALAGIRGRPAKPKRLPEILTPEELGYILAQAYREQPRYGLIVRTLFETGLRVSELVRVQAPDVDFTERTIRVREGKGGKDRLVLFTDDLGQQLRLHLNGRPRGALFESNRARPYSARMIQHVVEDGSPKGRHHEADPPTHLPALGGDVPPQPGRPPGRGAAPPGPREPAYHAALRPALGGDGARRV